MDSLLQMLTFHKPIIDCDTKAHKDAIKFMTFFETKTPKPHGVIILAGDGQSMGLTHGWKSGKSTCKACFLLHKSILVELKTCWTHQKTCSETQTIPHMGHAKYMRPPPQQAVRT